MHFQNFWGWLSSDINQKRLISYFRSGWAFLIPYLIAYLLYAWTKWPVNPAGAKNLAQGSWIWIPCLLYVYWFLHSIHLILGAFALHSWWRNDRAERRAGNNEDSAKKHSLETVYCILPWVFLAILFYIPGAYLEWPSDPWEHLSRITYWDNVFSIGQHPNWMKMGYFFPYSILGLIAKTHIFAALDAYLAVCSLLLSWNYFRLGRVTGLSVPFAFCFAAWQGIFFGNNTFSFMRYYGLSTTIFAQIGVIALIQLCCSLKFSSKISPDTSRHVPTISTYFAVALLGTLILFNHPQGIGIALLGLLGIGIGRLVIWKRYGINWLIVAAIILGILAILTIPRSTVFEANYRPNGWLTRWYGFNLIDPSSPAFERANQILGLVGWLNLLAGIFLCFRKHIAGWITSVPFLAMLHPLLAIPLSNFFADLGGDNIVVYHRLLFAIPSGLALLTLGQEWSVARPWSPFNRISLGRYTATPQIGPAIGLVSLGLFFLTAIPGNGPFYNRLWHSLFIPPKDLNLSNLRSAAVSMGMSHPRLDSILVASPGTSFVYQCFDPVATLYSQFEEHRVYHNMSVNTPGGNLSSILQLGPTDIAPDDVLLGVPNTKELFSPYSQASLLSDHWTRQEVDLCYAGAPELAEWGKKLGLTVTGQNPTLGFFSRRQASSDSRKKPPLKTILQSRPSISYSGYSPCVYVGEFVGAQSLASGIFIAEIERPTADRHWANLLALNSNDQARCIYLYIATVTGEWHMEFFGNMSGPIPWPSTTRDEKSVIQLRWRDGLQELSLNGVNLAVTHFAADKGKLARGIRFGGADPSDPDFWHGPIHLRQLQLSQDY